MDFFDYFSNYIFPPLILCFGLIGNFLGFKTMLRPKMLEIGPRNTYKFLFIMDAIYLVQIIVTNLQLTYRTDISTISKITCKLWVYLTYSLDSPSSMLLVYISIDRYVSIKMPAQRFFMRKRNNQFIYFIFIFMFNLICDFIDENSQKLISYMDFSNLIIMPSFLIISFSLLLGIEVIKSKSRILANFEREENKYYFKSIRLAISSICLNIIYVLLEAPLAVVYFLPNYHEIYGFTFFYYLIYVSYSINFYVIFVSNSLFRKEFILSLKRLFCKKK